MGVHALSHTTVILTVSAMNGYCRHIDFYKTKTLQPLASSSTIILLSLVLAVQHKLQLRLMLVS